MTGATSGALRHLLGVERRLEALERAIGALEDLQTMLGQPPGVATQPTHVEIMQEVSRSARSLLEGELSQ
jgi:hypothetical protein